MDFKYRKLYSADEICGDRGEGRNQGTRLFRKKMFGLTIFDKVILVTLTESFLKLFISLLLLLLLLPLLLLLLYSYSYYYCYYYYYYYYYYCYCLEQTLLNVSSGFRCIYKHIRVLSKSVLTSIQTNALNFF